MKELRNIEAVVSDVRKKYAEVKAQLELLRSQREEIESADQDELSRVREEISIVNEGVETRKLEMEAKEKESKELASEEEQVRQLIEKCRGKIEQAERIKEMNRGFEKEEIQSLKSNLICVMRLTKAILQCLKHVSGWEVVKIDGDDVTIVYRGSIVLAFNVHELSRGGAARVDMPSRTDPLEEFTFLVLNSAPAKGEIWTVSLQINLSDIDFEYHLTDTSHSNSSPN